MLRLKLACLEYFNPDKRKRCEDVAYGCGNLVSVVDGVGVGARDTALGVSSIIKENQLGAEKNIESGLDRSIYAANEFVRNAGRFGCEVIVGVFKEEHLYVINVGGGVCFRLRGQKLERLTKDQYEAAKRAHREQLNAFEQHGAWISIHYPIYTLGVDPEMLSPSQDWFSVEAGDSYVFCTDLFFSEKKFTEYFNGCESTNATPASILDRIRMFAKEERFLEGAFVIAQVV